MNRNRREFLKTCGKYSLTVGSALYLPTVQANCCRLSWWSIFKIQPARIVAGLIFDQVAPVAVRWVANGVSSLMSGSYSSSYGNLSYGGLASESTFNHPAYKAAVVVLGVADYEAHRQRQLRLLLNDAVNVQRFGLIRDYFRDEKVLLKAIDKDLPYRVGMDFEPDDLFMLDYFEHSTYQAQHYKNLEEITQTTVFKQWYTG